MIIIIVVFIIKLTTVAYDFCDTATPASDPLSGPTLFEKNKWDKQQRMLCGISLLLGSQYGIPAHSGIATIVSGRNQWYDKTFAENMSDKVGSLQDNISTRLMLWSPWNSEPRGPIQQQGEVLYRQLNNGIIYVNCSNSDITINNTIIPARDIKIIP